MDEVMPMNFTAVAQSKWFDSAVCLSKYVILSCSDVEISEAVNQPGNLQISPAISF